MHRQINIHGEVELSEQLFGFLSILRTLSIRSNAVIFSMSVLHSANNFCKTKINTTITLQICEVSYCLQQIFFEALLYKEKGKSVIVKVKRYSLSYH